MTSRQRMEIEGFALSMLWRVGEVDWSPYNFSREPLTIARVVQMVEERYGHQGREVLRGIRVTLH
jgi:hypothetical protein